jgi:hypothetical protein
LKLQFIEGAEEEWQRIGEFLQREAARELKDQWSANWLETIYLQAEDSSMKKEKKTDRWGALADEMSDTVEPEKPKKTEAKAAGMSGITTTTANIKELRINGTPVPIDQFEIQLSQAEYYQQPPRYPERSSSFYMKDCSLDSVRRARNALQDGGQIQLTIDSLLQLLSLCVESMEQAARGGSSNNTNIQPVGRLYLNLLDMNVDYGGRAYYSSGPGIGYVTAQLSGDLSAAGLFTNVRDFGQFREAVLRCV